MAKGYWIVRADVKDEEPVKRYVAGNHPIFEKFGGRFLVRSQKFEVPEGSSRSLNVVIEFPDYASALACYHSSEYQTNKKIRDGHLVADFVIVEGYDGLQPPGQAGLKRFSGLFVRE
jgi:uncharacterized protein (DUF1330 family)